MKGASSAPFSFLPVSFHVLDPDRRAVTERVAVRTDAVPARSGAHARLRHHGHDQPRARLALHAGRLPRRDSGPGDRIVYRRRAPRDPGHRAPRHAARDVGAAHALRARPPVAGARDLRAHPDPQRSGAHHLGAGHAALRACGALGVRAAVAGALYLLVARTRIGMLVRAGASNREMALAMGVNIGRLFTLLFGVGAGLCAVAGALLGPLFAVQVGMGENILILAFVVIVIGGIGSIRGALVGSLLVGVVDTIGR